MFFTTPPRAALVSVTSNTVLVAIKVAVAVAGGSAAILSEAMHSSLDLLAALMAWISLKFAAHPPDSQHPYGHGKWENLSAFVEGLLILAVALGIFYEAGHRLFTPEAVSHVPLGLAVMAVSALVNFWVSWALHRAARRFDSVALEADAEHLRTDIYTSVGAFLGLLGYYLTGHLLFDTATALVVGVIIAWVGGRVVHTSLHGILDTRLPAEEEEAVRQVIAHTAPFLEVREINSRKAGPVRYLDLTLVVCRWENLGEIHQLCDRLEQDIQVRFPGARVFIHPEPCLLRQQPDQSQEACACPLRLNLSYPLKPPA